MACAPFMPMPQSARLRMQSKGRKSTNKQWLADTGTRRRHSTSTAEPEREKERERESHFIRASRQP